MNRYSHPELFSIKDNYSNSFTDKSFIPSNYIDPELYFFIESEGNSSSYSSYGLLYLLCGLATLIFASIGLWVQSSQLQQAAQEIENKIYDDYSALINH